MTVDAGKVVTLATANKHRQPPLTDDELVRIRAMLQAFDELTAANGCPVARQILYGRE